MDESRCDNNTGTELLGEEVDIERNAETRSSLSDHREECGNRGDDTDNKDGGDTRTELTIVVIAGGIDVADYLCWIGCCEVDIVRVEGHFGWVRVRVIDPDPNEILIRPID